MIINKTKLVLWETIIILILIISAFILFKLWRGERTNHVKWESNYYALGDSVSFYKTKSGKNATLVRQLTFSTKELKSSKISTENALNEAKKLIDDLRQSNKKLKTIILANLNAQGQGSSVIHDTVFIDTTNNQNIKARYASVNDGYLFEDLFIYPDTVNYNYTYQEGINIIMNMRRKLNRNGNKVFWLWRWIKPWIPQTSIVSQNPNSKISAATQINFEK